MEKKHPYKVRRKREELLSHIQAVVKERPTYGYRRVTALLNRERLKEQREPVNLKRVYRIMRDAKLLLQKPKHGVRAHTGKVQTIKSNLRWSSDPFTIQCLNGEKVHHVAFSIDTCDLEVMRYSASTAGINGQSIRDLMVETVEYRLGKAETQTPIQWLTDNGGCYTAKETVAFGKKLGLEIRTTPAYSPESNRIAEALVKTLKRDYV